MSSAFDTYRLYYSNGCKRADLIRFIFIQGNQKFEDILCKKDDEFLVKSEIPSEQLPILEFNGEKYPQSMAMIRFIARKFHLTGKSDLDQFKCDTVAETIHEMNEKYFQTWSLSDNNEEDQKTFIENYLPLQLKRLETLFDEYSTDGKHFVGDIVTWADLIVYSSLKNILEIVDQEKLLNEYPKLKQNREEISKQPNIAKYLKSRSQISK